MNENFLEFWNRAKQLEEDGHKYFQELNYQEAAKSHNEAASHFLKAFEFLDETEVEIQIKTKGNYHIELANYHHSLATDLFYTGEKELALESFKQAVEEQKKAIKKYEELGDIRLHQPELASLKGVLHFLLTYENICLGQLAFLKEKYFEAVDKFKTAEIHSNLEAEFISELGDLSRLKRAKARSNYIKGQLFRSQALLAIQKKDRKEAKEKYLQASQAFENASKLNPSWGEYNELAEKCRKMSQAIKE